MSINVNKVILVGRTTRDPESRTFANGGKVTNFGFVVNNRKKNQQTGQWEDDPVFIECSAFNRGDYGKLADQAEKLSKGTMAYVEGHLVFEQWTDKDGQKKSKLKVVADSIQIDYKGRGQQSQQPQGNNNRQQPARQEQDEGGDIPF